MSIRSSRNRRCVNRYMLVVTRCVLVVRRGVAINNSKQQCFQRREGKNRHQKPFLEQRVTHQIYDSWNTVPVATPSRSNCYRVFLSFSNGPRRATVHGSVTSHDTVGEMEKKWGNLLASSNMLLRLILLLQRSCEIQCRALCTQGCTPPPPPPHATCCSRDNQNHEPSLAVSRLYGNAVKKLVLGNQVTLFFAPWGWWIEVTDLKADDSSLTDSTTSRSCASTTTGWPRCPTTRSTRWATSWRRSTCKETSSWTWGPWLSGGSRLWSLSICPRTSWTRSLPLDFTLTPLPGLSTCPRTRLSPSTLRHSLTLETMVWKSIWLFFFHRLFYYSRTVTCVILALEYSLSLDRLKSCI